MKQILAAALVCALPLSSRAQVVDNFKAHTGYLASDELGGEELVARTSALLLNT